ncbi:MAG: hypothetical protein MZV63_67265 [Marinilabiliales bacterium]|nr:hypothetical protein [Marinilabiliales bacterium]
MLFSDLGEVYSLDPPMVPGINFGIDQVFGKKFYGGTGIHFNTLIGQTRRRGRSKFFLLFQGTAVCGFPADHRQTSLGSRSGPGREHHAPTIDI